MIKIIIGLICVMVANILLGATIGTFTEEFSWKKLLAGIVKAICIIAGSFLMYLCSYYNPEIVVTNINGINVNLIDAMKILFIAGIVLYGAKDLMKLKELLGVSTDLSELKKEETIEIPVENEIKE